MVGAVNQPKSFWTPVGTPFRELIKWSGGARIADFWVFFSGLMMGSLTFDLEDLVSPRPPRG